MRGLMMLRFDCQAHCVWFGGGFPLSGLLFSSNDGGKYYSFKDGSIVDYNIGWNDLYFSTPFTNIGKFFYVELAQSLESFSTKNGVTVPIGEKESYWGIFSSDS